jgi:putative endonuclease
MMNTTDVFVYIIETHYGTYYTGITNNILRRWKEHVAGQSSYLSKFKPKQIIHIETCLNRRDAHRIEIRIKLIGAAKYLNRLKYNQQNKIDTSTLINPFTHGTHY